MLNRSDQTWIIQKTANFVEQELKYEKSGHDWEYIQRVWKWAKKIGSEEKADMLLVELAALLHYIDDWKRTGNREISEPLQTKRFLENLKAPPSIISNVCRIIRNIDYRGTEAPVNVCTLEEKVVFDASKLDGLGAIGIARCFVFSGSRSRPIFIPDLKPASYLSPEEYANLNRKENHSINHFFERLLRLKNVMFTETGKKEAAKRHQYMVSFLERFFEEQDQKEWLDLLHSFLHS